LCAFLIIPIAVLADVQSDKAIQKSGMLARSERFELPTLRFEV
jgi:hypothetical protein